MRFSQVVLFALQSVSVLIMTIFGKEKMTGCGECSKLGNMLLYEMSTSLYGNQLLRDNKETNSKAFSFAFQRRVAIKKK